MTESLREEEMVRVFEMWKQIMSGNVAVEKLKLKGRVITEKKGMREAIRQFWGCR